MITRSRDVLVIGAGPIGIELAVALKRQGIDYAHVDAAAVGSTVAWFAPQTHFFSSPERIEIAGVPLQTLDQTKATREEYLNYLRGVVLQFDLQIDTYERVLSIRPAADGSFIARTQASTGERIRLARHVVLAIGDMHRPRLIGVAGEDLPHVSHYFAEPHNYFRRRVLIVGGRNSAVEAAIRCVRVGASVVLSYRRAELDASHIKFWLYPEINAMIRDGRVTLYPETVVCGITPSEVELRSAAGESFIVSADAVLLLTGYEQDATLFEEAGVLLEDPNRKPTFDPRTMETNVPGLFVAGTAAAGTQSSGVKEFIETSHVHVERIIAALMGTSAPKETPEYEMPES